MKFHTTFTLPMQDYIKFRELIETESEQEFDKLMNSILNSFKRKEFLVDLDLVNFQQMRDGIPVSFLIDEDHYYYIRDYIRCSSFLKVEYFLNVIVRSLLKVML